MFFIRLKYIEENFYARKHSSKAEKQQKHSMETRRKPGASLGVKEKYCDG